MRFLSLANRNLKELFRDPLAIGLGVAMPIGFLALFISIEKRLPLEMFTAPVLTPGITVFSFAFLMMFSGTMLVKDRCSAFLTRLLATPLKPVDYILAYILPFISIALLQIAACFGAGALLGFHPGIHALTSLLILVPAALISIGLGMLLGSLCTENQVPGFGSILITGTSLFSGAWMDLKAVGGIFADIGYALPFAHAIDATRAVVKGSGFGGIMTDLYWVYGYAVVLLGLGVAAFAWRTRR